MTHYEVETLHACECTIRDLRMAMLCSDASEALPPVAEAEWLSALAYLDLATQAVKRAELWRVHAKEQRR